MTLSNFEESIYKQYAQKTGVSIKFIQPALFLKYVLKRLFIKEVESTEKLTDDKMYELLNEIVIWYHKFGSTGTPDELLDYKDKIVTCSYWITQKLSDSYRKYNMKLQHNKVEIDRHVSQSSKTIGATAARAQAKTSKGVNLMEEVQYKAEVKGLENLLKSLDIIVSAMQQRIAWLRQEAQKTTQF